MLYKIFLLFLGIILISYSLFFMIVYLNLLNIGYSLIDYLFFIVRRVECLIFIVGVFFIFIVMRKEKHEKNK